MTFLCLKNKKWSKIYISEKYERTNFKTTQILEKKNSRQRHTIGITVFFNLFILWAQRSMPKIEHEPKIKNSKQTNVGKQ